MEATTYWPTEVKENEILFAGVDTPTGDIKYLVFSSEEKGKMYVRADGTWLPVMVEDSDLLNDLDVYQVTPDFIPVFDKAEAADKVLKTTDAEAHATNRPVLAAAGDCPPATQDIALNLENRQNAIENAGYGPLNPQEPNEEFWQKKADRWSVTIDDAKKSLCGNCAVFVITSEMKNCIAGGLEQGGSGEANAWDAIDQAELGYCEAFDFKCAASRTCDAWVTGGPIADTVEKESE